MEAIYTTVALLSVEMASIDEKIKKIRADNTDKPEAAAETKEPEEAEGEKAPAGFRRERQPAFDRGGPAIDEEPRLRAERGHGRVVLQEGELAGEPVGMGNIVGVHQRHDPRAGPLDPLLERRGEAAVGAAGDNNSTVAAGEVFEGLPRAVGRAVVDRQQLPVGKRLCSDALHGGSEEIPGIPHREHDGHARLVGGGGSGHAESLPPPGGRPSRRFR